MISPTAGFPTESRIVARQPDVDTARGRGPDPSFPARVPPHEPQVTSISSFLADLSADKRITLRRQERTRGTQRGGGWFCSLSKFSGLSGNRSNRFDALAFNTEESQMEKPAGGKKWVLFKHSDRRAMVTISPAIAAWCAGLGTRARYHRANAGRCAIRWSTTAIERRVDSRGGLPSRE